MAPPSGTVLFHGPRVAMPGPSHEFRTSSMDSTTAMTRAGSDGRGPNDPQVDRARTPASDRTHEEDDHELHQDGTLRDHPLPASADLRMVDELFGLVDSRDERVVWRVSSCGWPRWALRESNPRPSPCKGDALPAELSARAAHASSVWPHARHTTPPSCADRRVPPQDRHRSRPSAQSGRSTWQAGQISTCRPPETARTHGVSRLSGS